MKFKCGKHLLDLSRPNVMGVINVTPDSFYEGSRRETFDAAIKQAEIMLEAGATIIDVGGESTRPQGLANLSSKEEIERVADVIDYIANQLGALVSIDTSSSEVIKVATHAGASIINDVRALQRPGALEAAFDSGLPIILMHSLVEHPSPSFVPEYDDVVIAVKEYLLSRIEACEKAGIHKEKIILDPGFGGGMFGKTMAYDFQLIKRFDEIKTLGFPVLAGVSRKSFIGFSTNKPTEQRLAGSLAAATLLAYAGANIIRVHDVAETVDVIKIVEAVQNA